MRKKNNARESAKISLAFSLAFILQIQQISASVFPGRDPDKKAPSGPGKRAPDGAWKHMLFSYRSLKNQ